MADGGDFFRHVKKNQLAQAKALMQQHAGLKDKLKQETNAVAYACTQINTHGANIPGCDGPQDFLELIRMLLDQGVDPNKRGNQGVTPVLMLAANANEALSQAQIVRLLVERGADPDARIEWDPDMTPLNQMPAPPASVRDILRNAAPIRAEYMARPPEPAPQEGIPWDTLYPGKTPPQILLEALKWGDDQAIAGLLREMRAAVINQACGTYAPIQQAAMLGFYCTPARPGADESRRQRAEYWQDPAHPQQIIEMLLQHGEDPNRRENDGQITAVHYAAWGNDRDLVTLLLAYGADPTLKDLDGISALSSAKRSRNHELVSMLENGAAIQAHFQATGRHEWPIVADDSPRPPVGFGEPEPQAAAAVDDYVPQTEPGPRFRDRMKRISDRCLEISKRNGRPTKQKEVYERGVRCHVPQPPPMSDQDRAGCIAKREDFIAKTIQQLAGKNPHEWRHLTLQIKFSLDGRWQEGIDWGGLTKAFCKFMSECLFDADLPCTLFTKMAKDDDVDGLPPVSELWRMKSDKELASIPRWEERMRFVGRFIAYCLWTGETADLPMLPSVWALLLDKHLHPKDLMLDRPSVFKSYTDMEQMPPDEVEYVMVEFAGTDPGEPETQVPLGGRPVEDVTGENLKDFIRLSSIFTMYDMCSRGIRELRRGFGDIMDPDSLQYIASQEIAACELQIMVCGRSEVDVKELQQQTRYRNCDMASNKCVWFFEVLEGWQRGDPMCADADVRASMVEPFDQSNKLVLKVVEYVTGTNRAPAGGWQNLRDKGGSKAPFTIYNLDEVRNQMPRAHTCFNKLDLPDYDNREKLAKQVWMAVQFGMGFGDA